MSLNKQQIRAIIFYEWKQQTETKIVVKKMCDLLGQDIVKRRTVQLWYNHFNSGNFDLEDKKRSGRPKSIDDEKLKELLD